MKRVITITSVAVLAMGVALAAISMASAHAEYESSTPAKGAVVPNSPSTVTVTFAERIQKLSGSYGLTVEDSAATSVTSGNPTVSSNQKSLSVGLDSNLASGRYVVRWHNVSDDDGDPKEGAFSFYVKTQPTADDLAADEELAAIGEEEEEEATPTTAATAQATTVPPTTVPATPSGSGAPSTVTAPSTGTGSGTTGGSSMPSLFLLAFAAAGGATLLAGIRLHKDRS